jgi:hypothetical protein
VHPEQLAALARQRRQQIEAAAATRHGHDLGASRRGLWSRRYSLGRARDWRHAAGWRLVEVGMRLVSTDLPLR